MTKKINKVEKIETNVYGDDDWATPAEALHNISIPMKNVEMLDIKKVKKFPKLCTKDELMGIIMGISAMLLFFIAFYLLILFVG